jgi:hypothetical protein
MKNIKRALLSLVLFLFAFPLPAQEGSTSLLSDLIQVQKGRSKAVTSSEKDFNSNYDRRTYIVPGESMVLCDIEGPAIINHIWLTFNDARPNWLEEFGSARPDEIVLRMYWDDGEYPAVEAPLGDFFGAGFGLRRELRSISVLVEGGDGYNSYWQMPFFKRGRITVTNEGQKNVRSFYYHVDFTEYEKLPADTAYFCAQYRQEFPESPGKDYLILDAEGQGHYVGTVMSARSRSPFWFGEGDARIYIDGDTKPTIQGTGTEDYFLCAWGLNECLFPYFGCTYMSGHPSDLGVRYTLYRWHIADPIRFRNSIRFEIEHTGWISADETETGEIDGHVEREDDMATVAFWYQIGQPKRFTTLPPLEERIFPDLDIIVQGKQMIGTAKTSGGKLELQKGYDWTGEGQILLTPSIENPALELGFQIEKEELRGLVLRMTHAPDYGIYRIFLDGKDVTELEDYPDWSARGAMDFYNEGIEVKDYYLGSYVLASGKHTLRFECVGKNPFSKGNLLGLDSVRLRERWKKKRKSLRPAKK